MSRTKYVQAQTRASRRGRTAAVEGGFHADSRADSDCKRVKYLRTLFRAALFWKDVVELSGRSVGQYVSLTDKSQIKRSQQEL